MTVERAVFGEAGNSRNATHAGPDPYKAPKEGVYQLDREHCDSVGQAVREYPHLLSFRRAN